MTLDQEVLMWQQGVLTADETDDIDGFVNHMVKQASKIGPELAGATVLGFADRLAFLRGVPCEDLTVDQIEDE